MIRKAIAIVSFLLSLTSTATVYADSASIAPPSGLVGWWTGDDNSQDISGNHIDASWLGTPTYVNGLVGRAFDVQASSLSVPHNSLVSFTPGSQATFEFWAYRKSSDLPFHFFGKRAGTCPFSQINYQLGIDGTVPSTPINVWIHWAVVYGASGITWYTNGVKYVEYPAATFGNANTTDLRLGGAGTCERFIGYLDEFAMYNRALSLAEIQSIYSAGAAGKLKRMQFLETPTNQVVACGGAAVFNSVATNELGGLTYQWQFNGTNLIGQTSSQLNIVNASPEIAGIYTVVATSSSGQSITASATLGFSFLDLQFYSGITVQATIGTACTVEYTENLSPPVQWNTLTNIASVPSNPFFILDYQSNTRGKRFYRVLLPPCNP